MHYQWLKNHNHYLHSIWNNDYGFSGYLVSAPDNTISHIKNHAIVHIVQKENRFRASLSKAHKSIKNIKSGTQAIKKSNIDIYILDSGIDISHPDFEGRADWGWPSKISKIDKFGHGTHVAGLAGSKHFGVAKNVKLIAVKVLDDFGFGSSSAVINGIQYILKRTKRNPSRKAIINISFSGPKDSVLDHILNVAVQNGIAVVAAAGNDGSDACDFSPSRSSMVLTVGAMNDDQSKTLFSNDGNCVNAWALGVSVLSLWPNGGTRKLNGTSASAPTIAGQLALIWEDHPQLSPLKLYQMLLSRTMTT